MFAQNVYPDFICMKIKVANLHVKEVMDSTN